LRDSVEYNLVSKESYLKSADNITFDHAKRSAQELFDIVNKIHNHLKISYNRVVKILEDYYMTKRELVYTQANNSKT